MFKLLKLFLKNPCRFWIEWLIRKIKLEKKNNNLTIKYMASINNCTFGKYNMIDQYVRLSNVVMNDYTYITENTIIKNCSIGKFCSIGPNCRIGLGKHPSKDFVSTHPLFFSTMKQVGVSFSDKSYFEEFESINIGNDVWIGANCLVSDGVNIGDGAIIAAGSVVVTNVEAYTIVGGVPAKKIKYRFTQKEINFLKNVKWWDFDEHYIKDNFKKFHNINNFTEFLNKEKSN